jgi:hypothetical protein
VVEASADMLRGEQCDWLDDQTGRDRDKHLIIILPFAWQEDGPRIVAWRTEPERIFRHESLSGFSAMNVDPHCPLTDGTILLPWRTQSRPHRPLTDGTILLPWRTQSGPHRRYRSPAPLQADGASLCSIRLASLTHETHGIRPSSADLLGADGRET